MSLEDRYVTATPEGVSLDVTLAGLGSRLAAFSLDFTLQIIVFVAGIWVMSAIVPSDQTGRLLISGFELLFFVIDFIGYFIVCEMLWSGRSIGKKAAGTRVVRLGGTPVNFTASLLRNVARIIDWLPSFYLVGSISVLVSSNNQRLGDMMGGTLVIRERHAADRLARGTPNASMANWSRPSVLGVATSGPQLAPELASWDVSAVTDAEVTLVRRFLARRFDYAPAARARLAHDLCERTRPRVAGVVGVYDDEEFLVRLLTVKAARRA